MRALAWLLCVALALTLASGNAALADTSCAGLKAKLGLHKDRIFTQEPIDQLIAWEAHDNLAKFGGTTLPVALEVVQVPVSQVNVKIGSNPPPEVATMFAKSQNTVPWPKHPYNTSPLDPYLSTPGKPEFSAHFTASRSMILVSESGQKVLSIKMPTDRPHRNERQPEKSSTREDLKFGIETSEYIIKKDKQIGPDQNLMILREVYSVAARSSNPSVDGNGYIVRDLTPLAATGNYYLPAFSIPFVGGHIAAKNGRPFMEFWGEHYASAVGRAKAKLLLRYGIQLMTPNPQNILIELTPQGRPTGRLVFRDAADMQFVDFAAGAIGEKATMTSGVWKDEIYARFLDTAAENSMWRMNEEGPNRLGKAEQRLWENIHDAAYISEIQRALNVQVVRLPSDLSRWNNLGGVRDISDYLKSDVGQAAVSRNYELMRAKIR